MINLITPLTVYLLGFILLVISFVWALYKKKYDIAIGLFIVIVAYNVFKYIRGGFPF